MEDQLITLETAKLAKEKGFDWEVNDAFVDLTPLKGEFDTQKSSYSYKQNHNLKGYRYSAPTQSLLQRWLREVHTLYVILKVTHDKHGDWWYSTIDDRRDGKFIPSKYLEGSFSYEKSLEDGLQEALKLINNPST